MSEKILFVDDEPNVLSGIERQLRKDYDVLTAVGGQAGLELLAAEEHVAVIVSDMRMPEMNGAEFLAQASSIRSDAVQMILSGQAELSSTIQAVNDGNLFRFLTKPCQREGLTTAIEAALRQYRLVVAERDLLQRTLAGSVQLLTEVLSIVNPVAFSRSARIERYTVGVAEQLGVENLWQVRLAAMLSQLGCVTVPAETLNRVLAGRDVDPAEAELYGSHAKTAASLIGRIPRLEGVARIVAMQSGEPGLDGEAAHSADEQLSGEILKTVADFDLMVANGIPRAEVLEGMKGTTRQEIHSALIAVSVAAGRPVARAVQVRDLLVGMVLDEDVYSSSGTLLISGGHAITETALVYLQRFARGEGVREPFRALVPQVAAAETDLESVATHQAETVGAG